MMLNANLDIPMRGERTYIHSTDLLHSLDLLVKTRLSSEAWVRRLVLRKPAIRQIEAHFEFQESAFGSFVLSDGRDVLDGWLVETDRNMNVRRIAFDEERIAGSAIVTPGRAALLSAVAGYSSFEQAIVLLKILAAQVGTGHWVFTMLDLDLPFREGRPLECLLLQNILGRSIIAGLQQDNETVGRAQLVQKR
jgi:hypothetical protein